MNLNRVSLSKMPKEMEVCDARRTLHIFFCFLLDSFQDCSLKSSGLVVVDGPWMQTHSGFDPPAAETKSHCSAHHGCGYVRMKTRERACRGLHLLPGG